MEGGALDTKTDLLGGLQKDQPQGPLDFIPGDSSWTSDPEDCEMTHVRFKSLDLRGGFWQQQGSGVPCKIPFDSRANKCILPGQLPLCFHRIVLTKPLSLRPLLYRRAHQP